MSWETLYDDRSIAAAEPAVVYDWTRRLAARGYDDTGRLHGFACADLAQDLAKHRVLMAYNMALGKTRLAIAAADVRGTRHTLFVIPAKLRGEWEADFAALGLLGETRWIESLSDIDRYDCPADGTPVTSFARVTDAAGRVTGVRRDCPACGAPARRTGIMPRFSMISLSALRAIPPDSPHRGRDVRTPAVRNQWGRTTQAPKARMKYTFAWYLRRRAEAVVVDEAYNLSNPDALQTRAVALLKPRRRTLLTGTPVKGFPDNILTLVNWLVGSGTDLLPDFDPTLEGSRKRFLERFGTVVRRVRDDGSVYEKLVPRIKNADQFQAMLAPLMRRRVNLEPVVAAAVRMPRFVINTEQIEPDAPFRHQYTEAVERFVAWYQAAREEAKRNDTVVPRMTVLSKLGFLGQLASCPQAFVPSYAGMSSKQERAVEIILEAAARGKKAILFTEWVASSSWYASLPELAHLSPVRVTGSVTLRRKKGQDESERERRFREFRLGGSGLLVATARCAAEGLNLPEAEVVLFDSYPFTPSQQQQAWSRVLRPAQTADPVEISLLGVAGTIDDFLLALTSLKRLAIGEGIDYEEVAIDLEDVPDPLMYANHLVAASSAIDKTYAAIEWQERLKTQHAALHRR